ncbi:MAG: hypothetical protein JWO33_10 [Caulobacteraceae bacterium]|nr:hypothetical protein [Caulobacteraceae bacterium]
MISRPSTLLRPSRRDLCDPRSSGAPRPQGGNPPLNDRRSTR